MWSACGGRAPHAGKVQAVTPSSAWGCAVRCTAVYEWGVDAATERAIYRLTVGEEEERRVTVRSP